MKILKKVKLNIKIRRVNFGKISNEWLNQKENEIKQSTYANYKYIINKYLMPELKEISLNNLKKYNFNEFIKERIEILSSKTIRDIVAVLKSILKYAEENYNINYNLDKITIPKLEIEKIRTLTKREKTKLENYCLKHDSLRNIGIIICLYTGLRVGEICALKWKNIDLEKREIQVKTTLQRSYKKDGDGTQIIIDTPKTKDSIRNIPMTNKIYEILKTLKSKYTPEDYLLTGDENKVIEPRNYNYEFKKILRQCKVKAYKFHVLRHTFATDCINVGMDVQSLSEILGHSDVNVTLSRYVHSSYNHKKKYMEKL